MNPNASTYFFLTLRSDDALYDVMFYCLRLLSEQCIVEIFKCCEKQKPSENTGLSWHPRRANVETEVSKNENTLLLLIKN